MASVDIPAKILEGGVIEGGDGAVGTPTYSFTGDTTTGMYRSASGTVEVATGGTSRLTIAPTAVTSPLAVYGKHVGFRINNTLPSTTAGGSFFIGRVITANGYDTNSAYNSTTGRYVVPIAGYWEFSAVIRANDGQSDQWEVQWAVNGSDESPLEVRHGRDGSNRGTKYSRIMREFAVNDEVYPKSDLGGVVMSIGDFQATFLGV